MSVRQELKIRQGTVPLPYDVLFDEVPCYISIQDREYRILKTNRLFRETFEGKPGSTCYEIYKDRQEKCPVCPVEKTFLDGQSHKSEEMWSLPDGSVAEVIVYTTPIYNEEREIVAVMEMSTDITEVKYLQRKLKESQERLAYLFEEVPCYISVQDRDFRIVRANRKFKEDFGDEIGDHCYAVYKHREEECLRCPVAATFADGQVHTSEEVVTSKSGESIHVLVSTAPIRNGAGEIAHVMEMSTNITEIRRLQSQLESLGMLVGSISHGIKGLLTGLDGGGYFMKSGLEKGEMQRVRKGWDMMERNISKIRSMVLDVLYYAKDREPAWEQVRPRELAESVAKVLDGKAEKLGIAFRTTFAEGMKPFEGDAKALHSMLVNVLENSFDACRMDRVKTDHAVHFRVWQTMDHVLFELQDNGIGMDQETREKLFCMFFSSKGMEGTGLGLFIANKIAVKHGGKISVDSTPGKGSRFLIRVPMTKP
ncbi:MAG: ATP-binding protein [bacterium]